MNKALLLLILVLPIATMQAQTLAKNDESKLNADYYLMDKEFDKAKTNYLNILKSEPENADIKYRLGICYLHSEDEKEKAIPYLEAAVEKVSEEYNQNSFKETNAPIEALFLLGSAYRVNNELDKAIEAYNRYKAYLNPKDEYNLEVINQYINNCNLARDMMLNPVNMVATNMGRPLNSDLPNFNAVISGDGKTMLYTTPGRQGYDIFFSTFADTAWTTPKNITSLLGAGKFMKTTDLSYDGLTLLLTQEDPMNADIFVSHFSKGRWSKVEPMNKEINSKWNETHASLSADGKTLYFTSDRKGGEGDLDIYRSVLDEKGEWGKAENLGPVINTRFNEESPFITRDGQKLYFSSEGHSGIGGYDVFYYDFSNPGEGVINLGYPLNSTDNDLFFVPWGDGSTAYYSFRGSDSYGGRDIYMVYFPKPEVAEEPVAAVVEEPVAAVVEEPVAAVVEEALPVPAVVEEVAVPVVEEVPAAPAVVEELPTVPAVVEEVPVAVAVEEAAAPVELLVTAPDNAPFYKIQIMASRKPADLRGFNDLSGLTVAFSSDNWYRYTLGNTTSRQEAEKSLARAIAKGYSDAFIRTKSFIPQFTVQVMAVPGPVVDLTRFDKLPEISVIKGADNYCRYTTGEYATKEEALAKLDEIKALGYPTAFITKINNQQ